MESVQCSRCRCVRSAADFKVSKAGKRNKTCMRCSSGARKVAAEVADPPALKVAAEVADEIDRKIAAVVDPKAAWSIEPYMIEPHMQLMPEMKDRMRAYLAVAVDPNNIADTARRLVRCDLALSSAECQLADMKQQLADMKISHLQCALRESRHLKNHIESNFEPGMTWENFGQWVIDFHTPVNHVGDNDLNPTPWDMLRRLRPCNLKPVWNTHQCNYCYQRIDD